MIVITPTEAGLQHRITNAISAAIETVRRRVDATGTTEAHDRPPGQRPHPGAGAGPAGHRPAQGADRQDGAPDLPRGAPHDLGRGGEARRARRPATRSIRAPTARRATSCCARRRSCAATSSKTRSRPSTSRRNEPIIAFRFNEPGARKFGEFTKDARRPPVRHRARRQGDLGAGDPRADPRRLGPDQRQLHGRDRQPARHPAALRRAAGQAHDRRGAHGRRLRSAQDSIEAGKLAGIIGGIAIAFFMIFAYGTVRHLRRASACSVHGLLSCWRSWRSSARR